MTNSAADALVIQTVRTIRDRFGVEGLRDLVAHATRELQEAERAAHAEAAQAWQNQASDVADTQAWIAFTGESEKR